MTHQLELGDQVHAEIAAYCADGDRLAQAGNFEAAIAEYNKAWTMIPNPPNDWEASTWVLAAIADAAYQGGYLTSARKAIEYGMTCPGAAGNPFMHLRFGEILFEQNELEQAADELMRAYMGGGHELFASENPKYMAFLKTKAQI